MTRPHTWIGLGGLVVCVLVSFRLTNRPPSDVCVLECVPTLDLGEGLPGSELTGDLTIFNRSALPLPFSIERSCSCSVVSPDSGVIAVGEAVKVSVALRLKQHINSKSSATLAISSTHEQGIVQTCQVIGRGVNPFKITPERVDFGFVGLNAESVQPISLQIRSTDSTNEVARVGFSIDGNDFDIQLAFDRSPQALMVRPIASIQDGHHFGLLRVWMDDPTRFVEVPLSVETGSRLQSVPSVISMKWNSFNNKFESVDVVIVDRNRAVVGAVKSTEDSGIRILDGGPWRDGRRAHIKVVDNELVNGRGSIDLSIHIVGNDEPCKLKLIFSGNHPDRVQDNS